MPYSNHPQKRQNTLPPLDYLILGHLTHDLTDTGVKLGGTAAFTGLTASALGLQVGLITSFGPDLDPTPLNPLWLHNIPSDKTTTFKNISDGTQRTQFIFSVAKTITNSVTPKFPIPPKIVHFGPVANEVDPDLITQFPESLKCLTPQGWFRRRREDNKVIRHTWEGFRQYLPLANLAVISQEDVNGDEMLIEEMAGLLPVFAVTENEKGARVYWHNEAKFITAPEVKYVDDTGAGDIFAAAFFYRYYHTKDPWESGRFAVQLASCSVTRQYLDSIPKPEEIEKAKMELIGHQGMHHGIG